MLCLMELVALGVARLVGVPLLKETRPTRFSPAAGDANEAGVLAAAALELDAMSLSSRRRGALRNVRSASERLCTNGCMSMGARAPHEGA